MLIINYLYLLFLEFYLRVLLIFFSGVFVDAVFIFGS